MSESESWPRENQQSISGHGVGHHFEPDDYSLEIEDGGGRGRQLDQGRRREDYKLFKYLQFPVHLSERCILLEGGEVVNNEPLAAPPA